MAHPGHRIASWTLGWMCVSWLPPIAAAEGPPAVALPLSCKWDNVIAQTTSPADWSPSGTVAAVDKSSESTPPTEVPKPAKQQTSSTNANQAG